MNDKKDSKSLGKSVDAHTFYVYHSRRSNWNFTSREIIRGLEKDGWVHIRTQGDHWQLKHPRKKGKVTVPHPNRSFAIKTIKFILKQAGLSKEEFEKCLK